MNAAQHASPIKLARPFTILVVDDNRDFVEFVNVLLTHQGYTVRCAYGGQECLDNVRREPPDLIILDVMMPMMDGLTVCRELKQSHAALPVMLLTAKDDLATRSAAMSLGVSEFLAKPVNIEDFLTRVRTQRDNRQWNDDNNANLDTTHRDGDPH